MVKLVQTCLNYEMGSFQRFHVLVAFKSLHQSLLYCSNSCTSLHFKTLKSHTKTLKIRPYMFQSPLNPSSGGSMAVLRYVTELECWFTFVIKSVGMWLYVSSFCLCVCVCGYLFGRDQIVGWFIWIVWWCMDLQTLKGQLHVCDHSHLAKETG